jgi:sugar lactone lactonase YvrE
MTVAVIVIVGATVLLIFNSLKRPRPEAKPVAAKVTVTTFLSFPQDNIYPVGLARAADGTFYLTEFGTGAVLKSDLQGKLTPVVAAGGAISAGGSIAVATDGTLYVIDYVNKNLGSLKRITQDGTVQPFGVAPGNKSVSLFAQMTFDDQGNLYVTNPSYGEVWCFDSAGHGRVWWSAPAVGNVVALPTGIAFDAARRAFVIGDAGTGTIYRVGIADNGNAGDSLLLHRESGLDVHALTLDDAERVLFTSWEHDQQNLNRLEADGTVTLLANDFRDPTAIVYHDSKVYVANSDLAGLLQIFKGAIPSPFTARPPFTIDVVSIGS